MITIHLMGGLGNQLFEIFTAMSLALETGDSFGFVEKDRSEGGRTTYWNDFFVHLRPYLHQGIGYKHFLREQDHRYNPLPAVKDACLSGYFQSHMYFEKHYKEIRTIMHLDLLKENLRKKIRFPQDSVSLHFRLGDYKHAQHAHPLMSLEYYENSLRSILQSVGFENCNVVYFFEKEDTNQVNSNIEHLRNIFQNVHFSECPEGLADWEQMLAMSLCDHNVIANSTFSWFGDYFTDNEKKIVCYPSLWFAATYNRNVCDMFPASWKKIVC